ncbi:hypothetical protein GIB67_036665 [Kingdonia uniflora]|uniref:Uncharacterized protein n=1 Tax=Kingdonia uniflora TaxID=39325 RepID=A0A7J7LWB8_9MAGN|nr:hypothetical protein GIB67_036665 [Kingdonia uniflora]
MSNNRVVETISLFRSQLQHRRFDDETLRILESLLISKDVKSLLEMRSCLRDFMRSESVYVLKELLEKPVDQKLTVLEFFVRAFALVADVESCLALKYEALVLRERTSVSREWLRVSKEEWFGFAKDSLHNGFYSIVVKGCDNALSCTQLADAEINLKIKKLKDIAVNLVASHSGWDRFPIKGKFEPNLGEISCFMLLLVRMVCHLQLDTLLDI